MNVDEEYARAQQVVAKIRPLLAGHSSATQGAVLVELVAMWIAGHIGPDGFIDKFRADLLDNHMDAVRKLVPVEVAIQQERRNR